MLKTWSRANGRRILTCQRVLSAYVLRCQRSLRAYVLTYVAHVLTCSCANVSSLLMCSLLQTCYGCSGTSSVNMLCVLKDSRANVTCELTCWHANIPWVPCITCLAQPHDHLPTCFKSSVGGFNVNVFSLSAIVFKFVHNIGLRV